MNPFRHSQRFRHIKMLLVVMASLMYGLVAVADELVTRNTRLGVTQTLLLWQSPRSIVDGVILLIPGGAGNIGLGLKNGRAEAQAAYLFSNQREALLREGYAVAVIDAPSDQENMSQAFRASPQHTVDLAAVISEIRKRFPTARLVVMAHSRGTVSAGNILQNMADQISAVVLLSGLYQASPPNVPVAMAGPGLSQMNWASLKVPVLLIHHANDVCVVAPFAAAVATQMPMISVNGAIDAKSNSPCAPTTNHWFVGVENALGQEIFNWLGGKPWQRSIP